MNKKLSEIIKELEESDAIKKYYIHENDANDTYEIYLKIEMDMHLTINTLIGNEIKD